MDVQSQEFQSRTESNLDDAIRCAELNMFFETRGFIIVRNLLGSLGLMITIRPHRVAGLEMMVSSLELELELLDLRFCLSHFTNMTGRLSIATVMSLSEDKAESSVSSAFTAASMAP